MKNDWIRFNESDPDTFPKDSEDILVFREVDGFLPQAIVAFYEDGKFYSSETAVELDHDLLYWSSNIIKTAEKKLLTNNNHID